jgi:hypothetical protein
MNSIASQVTRHTRLWGDWMRKHRRTATILTLIGLALGIGLRIVVMRRGNNYDLESYRIVADILRDHWNVYALTERYNYGPVWFMILHVFDVLAGNLPRSEAAFRHLIVMFLIVVDLGIWYVLRRQFGQAVAFIFFLSPISIIITGYHNQFDNLAILIGLVGMLIYGEAGQGWKSRKFWGLLILGLSLATKHIFFALPLWLAFKEEGWKAKVVALGLPVLVFLAGFAPFWAHGHAGIIAHVFEYHSLSNAPFWHAMIPAVAGYLVSPQMLFFGALVVGGLVYRRRGVFEMALLYLLILVIFSSAIANQYLAIAVPAIAVSMNGFFWAYWLYAGLFLAISDAGLHIAWLQEHLPSGLIEPISRGLASYNPLVVLLFAGLVWMHFSRPIRTGLSHGLNWLRREIKWQLASLRR